MDRCEVNQSNLHDMNWVHFSSCSCSLSLGLVRASDSTTHNWLTRIPSDASKPVITLWPRMSVQPIQQNSSRLYICSRERTFDTGSATASSSSWSVTLEALWVFFSWQNLWTERMLTPWTPTSKDLKVAHGCTDFVLSSPWSNPLNPQVQAWSQQCHGHHQPLTTHTNILNSRDKGGKDLHQCSTMDDTRSRAWVVSSLHNKYAASPSPAHIAYELPPLRSAKVTNQ